MSNSYYELSQNSVCAVEGGLHAGKPGWAWSGDKPICKQQTMCQGKSGRSLGSLGTDNVIGRCCPPIAPYSQSEHFLTEQRYQYRTDRG